MLFFIDGEEREETIRIFTEKFKKPFLGGFRHRISNVEYHNASCQTNPKRRIPPAVSQVAKIIQDIVTNLVLADAISFITFTDTLRESIRDIPMG